MATGAHEVTAGDVEAAEEDIYPTNGNENPREDAVGLYDMGKLRALVWGWMIRSKRVQRQ